MRQNNRKQEGMTAHPSKYPQGYFKPKGCKWCSGVFHPISPAQYYCSDTCKDKAHADNYYKNVYNISYNEFIEMYDRQDCKCAICKGDGFRMHEGIAYNLVVDHCHSTGRVRGLLCNNCNRALGLFKDNVRSLTNAISYLESSTTISKESREEANASRSGEPPCGG